jgi:protein phosphatase 1 regulatory subunit 11
VCCIYHKPRAFGESSDESSSSSSSDEDSSDDERVRPTNPRNSSFNRDGDDEHGEDVPNGGEPCEKHAKSKRVQREKRKRRRSSPNAYERVPKYGRSKEKETDGGEADGEGEKQGNR